MTYDELLDFIEHRMQMSHVYQPLMIRALVDAGGSATIRHLAHAFLVQDESQLLYYEKRIREMPLRVLRRHGVVSAQADLVTLSVPRLTLSERAGIRLRCEQKLQEFVTRRGLAIWDYRLLETDPVPDTVYYSVMLRAGGRCELCGATKKETVLHVDHIKPRSKGGTNDPSNLQVLCQKCNLAKSNRDQTDLRGELPPDTVADCPFCQATSSGQVLETSTSSVAIADKYPVTEGHCLIVPRRHAADYFSLSVLERQDADDLLRVMRHRIMASDARVTGFNVGANCGMDAGQTILHAHIHLIPRRSGDSPQPRGGVRGVIPAKMAYGAE